MSATGDLLDVNVWLAFALEGHPHHREAVDAWSDLDRPSFCRVTQLSFVRLLGNADVMGRSVFEPERAWAEYERMKASGAVHFREEPAALESSLKGFTKGAKASRDFWTDAYLAAFARSGGMRLVTFDTGFMRFRSVEVLLLGSA